MKTRDGSWPLMFVYFVLGVLVVLQLRSTGGNASVTSSTSDQAQVLTALIESNNGLRAEIAELEAQLARLTQASQAESSAALQAELNRLLVLTGTAPVSGPGVRVEILGQINALDMQDMINELRNAGVEAIAVDGYRVIVRSVVSRDGSDLMLDGNRLVPPHVLEAIGETDTIQTALLRRGGLVSLLQYAYPGLTINVTTVENVTLPAYRQSDSFKFARPVQ